MKNRISSLALSLILPIIILIPRAALAEHIAMTATGEYTMGDNDTYIEAKQLALQDAKHILFKNMETYIGSKTGASNGKVSSGDIGPYLPGMVDIEEIGAARTILKNKTIVATVIVKALVDPDAIMGQVASLRDKKDIEASAKTIQSENAQLGQELERINEQLKGAVDEEIYVPLRAHRADVLRKMEHNEKELALMLSDSRPKKDGSKENKKESQADDDSLLGITIEMKKPNLLFALFNVPPDFIVTHVTNGSAANIAGLQSGDIINEIDEKYLYTLEQYHEEMLAGIQKREVMLSIRRGFRLQKIAIKL